MNLIYFLLIGLIAGWLAGNYMEGRGFGLIGNILVGIVGAVLGGFLFGLLGVAAHSLLGELITATLGAILFLYLIRWHKRGP